MSSPSDPSPASSVTQNASRHMFFGSLWMIGMRWSMKAISLFSSIILIRLLDPENFGLMAKAIIFVGLVEVLLDSGFKQSLIKKEHIDKDDYDTVFTLNLCMGLGVFTVLLIGSPFFAAMMNEPRLAEIIPLLGIRALVYGFSSPKTANFLRNFEYSKDFWFNVIIKFITVPATIVLAFTLGDYRALIGGQIVSQVSGLVLSYIMAPYLPRLCLSRVSEMWRFSMSFISLNYAIYVTQRMDEMFLMWGKTENDNHTNNHLLGFYTIASQLGCLFTYEILYPLTRSLFPVFARLKEDKQALAKSVRQVFSIVWSLALLCGVGTAIVGENLMLVLGGEQWRTAIPVLQWIGIASSLEMVNLVVGTVLQVTNHERTQSMLLWMKLTVLAATLCVALPLAHQYNALEALAIARTFSMAVFVPVHIFVVKRVIDLSYRSFFIEMWRPVLAMGMTFLLEKELHSLIYPFAHPAGNLLIQSIFILFSYLGFSAILWHLSGRPSGFESFLLRSIKQRKLSF